MKRLAWFWAVCILTLGPSVASAQNVAIAIPIPNPKTQKPTIDGFLQEWNPGIFSVAPPNYLGTGSGVLESGTEFPSHDALRFYAAADSTSLYLGLWVQDSAIQAGYRDGDMWRGDMVDLVFVDGKTKAMIHMGINPKGDLHYFKRPTTSEKDHERWTQVVVASTIEKEGYAIEVALPWKTLGYAQAPSSLPFNIAHKNWRPIFSQSHRVWSGVVHNQRQSLGEIRVAKPNAAALKNESAHLEHWPRCHFPAPKQHITNPLSVQGHRLFHGDQEVTLRLINFQGAQENWQRFWLDWRPQRIEQALDHVIKLCANSIRIFVFYEAFGGKEPKPFMVQRLLWLIQKAKSRGLYVVVSTFPFKKDFSKASQKDMAAHLRSLMLALKGETAIAYWDLVNEPDHSWGLSSFPGQRFTPQDVSEWIDAMVATARQADPQRLLSSGLGGHFLERENPTPQMYLPQLDVFSVHGYRIDPAELSATVEKIRTLFKGPIILQEFGTSSLHHTQSESTQIFEIFCTQGQKAGLSGVGVWELYDHPVGTIWHQRPRYSQSVENYFGLLRPASLLATGKKDSVWVKEQASSFARCLDASSLRFESP